MNRILLFLVSVFVICSCQDNETKRLPLEKEPRQTFVISAERDTLVIGNKGTRILFRSGGLVDNTGKIIEGDVEIRLQEFYTLEDFISNGLITQTLENKPLMSSGMIKLEAWQRDKRLGVNPNKPYLLKFQNPDSNSKLFIGIPGNDSLVKWELDSVSLEPIIQETLKIEKLGYGTEKVTQIIDTLGFINPIDGTKTYFSRYPQIERAVGDSTTDVDENEVISGLDFFIPNGFGYFNCDAFFPEETIELFVNIPSKNYSVQLIVDERNSVLIPVNCNEINCKFFLPKDLPITIYVCKKEGEKWFFDLKRVNSSDSVVTMNPVQAPFEKIKETLANLK